MFLVSIDPIKVTIFPDGIGYLIRLLRINNQNKTSCENSRIQQGQVIPDFVFLPEVI